MQPDLVLVRTQKGEEVILDYGHEISANQRHALLVVDGKTEVGRLEQKAFWVSDLIPTLEELLAMGFVQDQASAAGAEVGSSGDPGQQMRLQLVAIAKELLGGNAERIVKKIEETDGTPGALEQALLGCKKIIKLTINEEIADTFLQRGRKVIGK